MKVALLALFLCFVPISAFSLRPSIAPTRVLCAARNLATPAVCLQEVPRPEEPAAAEAVAEMDEGAVEGAVEEVQAASSGKGIDLIDSATLVFGFLLFIGFAGLGPLAGKI
jgi:hypothetical protein